MYVHIYTYIYIYINESICLTAAVQHNTIIQLQFNRDKFKRKKTKLYKNSHLCNSAHAVWLCPVCSPSCLFLFW